MRLAFLVWMTAGWVSLPLWAGGAEPITNAVPQPYCLATNAITPSFSPDGRQIVYYVSGLVPRIEILDLDSKTNRVLVENAHWPVWSPDGRWIAFQQTRMVTGVMWQNRYMHISEVLVVAPRGGRPRFVYPGVRPHWLGDGQRLFIVDEGNGQIVASRVDKPEDEPPVWWTLEKTVVGQISPDGRRVAVLTNENFAVFTREKKELEFLIPLGNARGQNFCWTPDSQSLLVNVNNTINSESLASVYWVDLQAQKIHCLSEGVWLLGAVSAKRGALAMTMIQANTTYLWIFPAEWLEARKAGRVPPFEAPPGRAD